MSLDSLETKRIKPDLIFPYILTIYFTSSALLIFQLLLSDWRWLILNQICVFGRNFHPVTAIKIRTDLPSVVMTTLGVASSKQHKHINGRWIQAPLHWYVEWTKWMTVAVPESNHGGKNTRWQWSQDCLAAYAPQASDIDDEIDEF